MLEIFVIDSNLELLEFVRVREDQKYLYSSFEVMILD